MTILITYIVHIPVLGKAFELPSSCFLFFIFIIIFMDEMMTESNLV